MLPLIAASEPIDSVRVKSSESEEIYLDSAESEKREKRNRAVKNRLFFSFLWNKDWNNL